jgi:hypothetical protein
MHCYICGWELDPSEIDDGRCSKCQEDDECKRREEIYNENYDKKHRRIVHMHLSTR